MNDNKDDEETLSLYDEDEQIDSTPEDSNGSKNKYLVYFLLILTILGGYYYYSSEEDISLDEYLSEDIKDLVSKEDVSKQEQPTEDSRDENLEEKEQFVSKERSMPVPEAESHSTSVDTELSLLHPNDGAHTYYDESRSFPEFSWKGNAHTLMFSKDQNMNTTSMRIAVSKNSFRVSRLHPGLWFWQVVSNTGRSETRSFRVKESRKRNIVVQAPSPDSILNSENISVLWLGDERIAHYRIELKEKGSEEVSQRFATTGTSLVISKLSPGSYDMRVGAFSEVSGSWEYNDYFSIVVQ